MFFVVSTFKPLLHCALIEPLLECATQVCHFGLTREQESLIGKIQKRALVIISRGPDILHFELLIKFDLVSMEQED